jgi:hypothetical protein
VEGKRSGEGGENQEERQNVIVGGAIESVLGVEQNVEDKLAILLLFLKFFP